MFLKELMLIKQKSASKECDICHYWYFLNKGFKFQSYLCNRCDDLLMISMTLNDISILKIKSCTVTGISKSEAIDLMQNID